VVNSVKKLGIGSNGLIHVNFKKIKVCIFYMKKLKNIVFECKLYIVISHKKKLHTHTHTHTYIYIYIIEKLRNISWGFRQNIYEAKHS
jgi:hypothetical protein